MIGTILAYVYAAVMAISTCGVMFSDKKMPVWLFILNLVASLLIAFQSQGLIWLIIGLSLVLVAAVLNGEYVFGKVHPSHFLVRLIISLIIVLMVYKKI
ncbi:hypothetical protein [Xylocopilactobacillus apicola]|uniref:Permease n=1 Tax=Xylocopilactobacillus apicola TaxID=2932184 RepID=A0AAU9D6T1_9LACO|nr:hypothetical protein [Xylocopilactobacillus apicola]BDR58076.1 hypothetical protein XA3_05170 [Xylocopilactobacillus apicola]